MSTGLGEFWDNWEKETKDLERKNKEYVNKIVQEAESMKDSRLKKMQNRYNFIITEDIAPALEWLESLAVDRFRNNDYYAQTSFGDVWWSVLHEVDMYEDGEEHCFRSVKSVEATKKWLKSFSHLCSGRVPDEYKC